MNDVDSLGKFKSFILTIGCARLLIIRDPSLLSFGVTSKLRTDNYEWFYSSLLVSLYARRLLFDELLFFSNVKSCS